MAYRQRIALASATLGKKPIPQRSARFGEGSLRKKPMNQDARLLLQLDRLQKQAEMHKARLWWRDEFWPDHAGDYLKFELAHGKKESRWLRQVPTVLGNGNLLRFGRHLERKGSPQRGVFARDVPDVCEGPPIPHAITQAHRQSGLHGERRAIHSEIEEARKRLRLEAQRLTAPRKAHN
jgi:hypothetical protein